MRIAVLVATILVALAACGGSSLTATEYFEQVEVARADYESELDELDASFTNAISAIDYQSTEAEQQLATLFKDQVNANAAAFRIFTESLKTLDPPGVYSASHSDAVTAAEAVVALFRDLEVDLNAIRTLSDIDAFAADSEISNRRGRFVEACRELQTLADQDDIAVDLSCGS